MKPIITLFVLSLLLVSCNNENTIQADKIKALQIELDSLKTVASNAKDDASMIMTFLTFQKEDAEEAMNFYVDLFDNSKIIDVKRWEQGAPGKEGTIMQATFSLDGKLYMCSDSPPIHDWDFTPAISNFVECNSEAEQAHLFAKLSENGQVFMPLNNYGFSQKFGWVVDRFGISWQINLP